MEVSGLKFVWYCAMANKRAERERRKRQDFRHFERKSGRKPAIFWKGFAGLLGEERGLKFFMVQGIANEVAERERRKRQDFRLLKGKRRGNRNF